MIKLSPYHEIFYNEWKLNPERSDYNIVFDNEMHGEIERNRLEQALYRLSQDYFLLHSNIIENGSGYYWVAQPGKSIKLDYFDTPVEDERLLEYVKAPFNLKNDALLRVALIKLATGHFRVILVIHHLLMDGEKENFIFQTIPKYYNDDTWRFDLPIEEQRQRLQAFSEKYLRWLKANSDAQQQFWRNQLTDLPGVNLQFLTSSEKPEISGNIVGEQLFTFHGDIVKKIKSVAKKYASTPYLLSLSIFSILLFRHTQQEKMGMCIPIAIPDGAEFIYGANVNRSIFSCQLRQTSTLSDVIERTGQYFKLIESENHGYFPFQQIPSALVSNDLMDVTFTETTLKNGLSGFQGILNETVNSSLNIDLTCKLHFLYEMKNNAVYYRVLFQKEYIDSTLLRNFIATYQRVFVEILDDLYEDKHHEFIFKYDLLDKTQRNLITQEWNKTEKTYPDKTLHQLFEDQVEKAPEAIALIFENVTWTYGQLNKAANQLAHHLRNHFHIQADDVISLCFKSGIRMIIGIWATLKSGAAYLPIDRAHPDERIIYMLKDTSAKIIMTDEYGIARFNNIVEQEKITVVNLDSQQTSLKLLQQSTRNPEPISQTHHLAYVIYTSGTQGQPKGVLIEQRSVVNYVTYVISENQLSEASVGAKYASFSFDASVIEIYPILLSGGKLCIIKEEDRLDCEKVNSIFHQNNVTFAFLPTPFAELFFEFDNFSLKNLMVGGDKLKKFTTHQYRVINAYGPTENTVQVTAYIPQKNEDNIPIGKPINNMKCYVVDEHCALLPIGSVGELLVGGDGLARNYLNLPELTAKKFICNPFQSDLEKIKNKNERLYKTGDLVRWLPNGNLEYIGRNDTQIKIRGYRIELSEIEHKLLQHPDIEQAAVIAANNKNEPGKKYLVAYYTAKIALDHTDLNSYLSQWFPAYMLPSAYMQIDKLPLSTSGKINKNALPLPLWQIDPNSGSPINSLEKKVCSAYAKILGLQENQVSIHHSFFELGGNSISAMRLTFLLRRHFKINVMDIFKLRTPANLVLELQPVKEDFLLRSQQIKKLYQSKMAFTLKDVAARTANKTSFQHYLDQVKQLNPDVITQYKLRSVLLTGATGFLGSHILAALLKETSYHIYLPVRAASDKAAFDRINKKFRFYFKADLENKLSRITVFAASLDDENLGLKQDRYNDMVSQIDSIIHCAALVKYYGHEEEFHKANIQPTIQLLKLAKLTSEKNFHYISSVGVLLDVHVIDQDYYFITEDDNLSSLVRGNHPYIESKYKAEQLVIQSRLDGIKGTIYRVGNQAMNSHTNAIQENFEDNMFLSYIRTMINFQIIPDEIRRMEVSPVEYTALALVKLFNKPALSNQTYHVFNPEIVDLKEVIGHFMAMEEQDHSMEKLIELVISNIERNKDSSHHSCLFMLYQFWLQQIDDNHSTTLRIVQNKTEHILAKLGFHWPTLSPTMFQELINKSSPLLLT